MKTIKLSYLFLFLLLDKNYFDKLSSIIDCLTDMNNQRNEKIVAQVQTNQALAIDLKQALAEGLEIFFKSIC